MDKQEQLEQAFQTKKRSYEDKEERLFMQRDKGLQDLEEMAERTHYYLKDYVPNQEMITQALYILEGKKEEIYEAAKFDKSQLEREIEDLEECYHREVRQLSNQELTKKESDF